MSVERSSLRDIHLDNFREICRYLDTNDIFTLYLSGDSALVEWLRRGAAESLHQEFASPHAHQFPWPGLFAALPTRSFSLRYEKGGPIGIAKRGGFKALGKTLKSFTLECMNSAIIITRYFDPCQPMLLKETFPQLEYFCLPRLDRLNRALSPLIYNLPSTLVHLQIGFGIAIEDANLDVLFPNLQILEFKNVTWSATAPISLPRSLTTLQLVFSSREIDVLTEINKMTSLTKLEFDIWRSEVQTTHPTELDALLALLPRSLTSLELALQGTISPHVYRSLPPTLSTLYATSSELSDLGALNIVWPKTLTSLSLINGDSFAMAFDYTISDEVIVEFLKRLPEGLLSLNMQSPRKWSSTLVRALPRSLISLQAYIDGTKECYDNLPPKMTFLMHPDDGFWDVDFALALCKTLTVLPPLMHLSPLSCPLLLLYSNITRIDRLKPIICKGSLPSDYSPRISAVPVDAAPADSTKAQPAEGARAEAADSAPIEIHYCEIFRAQPVSVTEATYLIETAGHYILDFGLEAQSHNLQQINISLASINNVSVFASLEWVSHHPARNLTHLFTGAMLLSREVLASLKIDCPNLNRLSTKIAFELSDKVLCELPPKLQSIRIVSPCYSIVSKTFPLHLPRKLVSCTLPHVQTELTPDLSPEAASALLPPMLTRLEFWGKRTVDKRSFWPKLVFQMGCVAGQVGRSLN